MECDNPVKLFCEGQKAVTVRHKKSLGGRSAAKASLILQHEGLAAMFINRACVHLLQPAAAGLLGLNSRRCTPAAAAAAACLLRLLLLMYSAATLSAAAVVCFSS